MLKKVLKEPKKNIDNLKEYEFNCPSSQCKHDKDKFNLNFSPEINIFRCWKCKYKGFVHRIFEDYGTEEDLIRIKEIVPAKGKPKYEKRKNNFDENITCELPEGYRPLTKKWNSKYYYKAMEYLRSRRVDDEMIKKFQIGYTESGPRKFRIIIPSFNKNGDVNYYEARSYLPWVKPAYYKPDAEEVPKSAIIFNVSNVDFNLPTYLVEGVFDLMVLYNAIPLLGKEIPDILLAKLIKYKTKVILCLDEDALKDSVEIYNCLIECGIDVYFVEIKDDIAKYYEKYGKEALIEVLKAHRKLDLKYIVSLIMKDTKGSLKKKRNDEKFLEREWNYLKSKLIEE
nr:DNA primase [uncultured archaeon]